MATALFGKKIIDNRRLNPSIENTNKQDNKKLLIEPSHIEQIDMLLHHTEISNISFDSFKLNFSDLYSFFLKKKDVSVLKIIADRCVKKDFEMEKDKLQDMLIYCFNNEAYDLGESIVRLCPKHVIAELLMFIEQNVLVTQILKFFEVKKELFTEEACFIDIEIIRCSGQDNLNTLLTIFSEGELWICKSILRIISDEYIDTLVFTQLLNNLSRSKNKTGMISDLKELITSTLYYKKLDLTELILKSNFELLSNEKLYLSQVLFQYAQEPLVLELLLKYGVDVNTRNEKGMVFCEWILDNKSCVKRQKLFDILFNNSVDLNIRLINAPKNVEMTLLGYLPFLNIKVNKKLFDAIRLQKFLAMFLEIPDSSISNGTLCFHGYMVDTHAYFNFILNLYFNEFSFVLDEFNECLKTLYTDDGCFDAEDLYKGYLEGKPIVMPVYIKDRFGSLHVATIGLLRIGSNLHFAVEGDRGFGRKDYSVYTQELGEKQFYKYAQSKSSPIYDFYWHEHKGNSIFSKKLNKQEDNFCPSISTQFSFHISYFLCCLKKEIKILESNLSNDTLQETISLSYKQTQKWYYQFCLEISTLMLNNYKNLDSEYIDSNFLEKIENKIHQKNKFNFEEIDEVNSLVIN